MKSHHSPKEESRQACVEVGHAADGVNAARATLDGGAVRRTVIYHANCVDGFTAAYCAWLKFGDECAYVPAQYGQPAPEIDGRDVVIVDFSYPRAQLEEMATHAASLQVLDHHKTAQADLEGLPFCIFDMERSGAGLTWDVLHGGPRPKLVSYVEDRDLWRWKLPDSKAVSQYIGSWERSFETWQDTQATLEVDFDACVAQGCAILRALDGYVEHMSDKARVVRIGGHDVPCINTTHAVSEVVGALAENAPFAPFAAGWFQRDDGRFVYSLRSRGDFDVSAVAKQYGGGGHKGAAGFTVDALL